MANTHSKPRTTIYKISQPERYSQVGYRINKSTPNTPAINLSGKWLREAGFNTGQSLKLRIMPGCIVITVQDIREFWYCLKELSIAPFDEQAAVQWIRQYPGGINIGNSL
ncbi:hypothetical protein BF17_03440 [Yersinia similis]|uniref:Toxin SymE-like domain-containing protein n=1 Tax=Yersinia similis TaxID=367190 RepID=A0ABM5PW45_9GAMM|nr:SymE family type I addiction module toxin [Yersinia similis]AHK18499.1 hypothetical protein BF17_03440 [Yersinia similis]CFQ73404.1 Putative endoribonuclease symE [Yersinia similis]CNF74268.1 Putative endoribonuclease symE [Yersinia similis]